MKWRPMIGEIRRSQGKTQKFVAKAINVSFQSLSDWERGRVYPTADHLFDIAEELGVNVGDLYKKSTVNPEK